MRSLIANLGLIIYFFAAVFFVFIYVPLFFIKNAAIEPELSLRYLAASGVVIAMFWAIAVGAQSMMQRFSMVLAVVAIAAWVSFYLNAVTYDNSATSELVARGHWVICVAGGLWAAYSYGKLRKAEEVGDN